MRKRSRCKKFENLEEEIMIVINNSEKNKTINEIRNDLENKGTKASWFTVRDYLESLYKKKKINKISFGNNIKFLFWGKK